MMRLGNHHCRSLLSAQVMRKWKMDGLSSIITTSHHTRTRQGLLSDHQIITSLYDSCPSRGSLVTSWIFDRKIDNKQQQPCSFSALQHLHSASAFPFIQQRAPSTVVNTKQKQISHGIPCLTSHCVKWNSCFEKESEVRFPCGCVLILWKFQ